MTTANVTTTEGQKLVLWRLYGYPQGRKTSVVADQLSISNAAAYGRLERLERKGLVKGYKGAAADNSELRWSLTRLGSQYITDVMKRT